MNHFRMMHDVKNTMPQVGRLEWIGLAAEPRGPITSVDSAEVEVDTGIVGEHHAGGGKPSKRQVTLIQQEHLGVVAALTGRESVMPDRVRRNLVVSGINLIALKEKKFRVGEVLLEGTGPCAPCSLMEYNLGPGGFNAMRGHGGITAVVLEGGRIRVGDAVRWEEGVME
jgi:MOSC domain-containing protein YiiM